MKKSQKAILIMLGLLPWGIFSGAVMFAEKGDPWVVLTYAMIFFFVVCFSYYRIKVSKAKVWRVVLEAVGLLMVFDPQKQTISFYRFKDVTFFKCPEKFKNSSDILSIIFTLISQNSNQKEKSCEPEKSLCLSIEYPYCCLPDTVVKLQR